MPRKTKQSGNGLSSTSKKVLKKAHDLVKQHQLISRGLAYTPLSGVAPVVRMLGYGKKKPAKKKPAKKAAGLPAVRRAPSRRASVYKTQVGNGIFSDLGGGIGSVFGGLGSGLGSLARGVGGGLFGGGRAKSSGKSTKGIDMPKLK